MNTAGLKIAFISAEAVPYAKAGGLGDVAASLPKALQTEGHDVRVFIPNYSSLHESFPDIHLNLAVGDVDVTIGDHIHEVYLYNGRFADAGVPIYFIDCAHYFKNRWLYTNDPDENERFILFNLGVLEMLKRLDWQPDIIHLNDWPTGLIAPYLKHSYASDPFFMNTHTVFTIHNIGYAGKFEPNTVQLAGLSQSDFYPGGPLEFYGSFSFLKAGLVYSDKLTTVSPTYAKEILEPEIGAGFDGVLNSRKGDLIGILNGVDYDIWNPQSDPLIKTMYSIDSLEKKEENKKYLCEIGSLPYSKKTLVLGIVSRLVPQKGFDMLFAIFPWLMQQDVQLVVLGSGDHGYEDFFRQAQLTYPKKVFSFIGYDNRLSHLIEAGSDVFLMPSLYEPCGLNQIYSLRYGTVPLVRKTGGLADTIVDVEDGKMMASTSGNGFTFDEPTPEAFQHTLSRVFSAFKNKKGWRQIQKNGMIADFSWIRSAVAYSQLYQSIKQPLHQEA